MESDGAPQPLRIITYTSRDYDEAALRASTAHLNVSWRFITASLDEFTVDLARDCDVVCLFVSDKANAANIAKFKEFGIKLIALRSAGYDHVDLEAAKNAGIPVTRVPAYSPYAVAEHAVALMLTLNRKTHKAYNRTHASNFALTSALLGFDMHGKTAGVIGTGKIGRITANILKGFGMNLVFYDMYRHPDMERIGEYVELDELCRRSDIITIHCPLTPATHHLINDERINCMKPGVMIINTSRGAVIDTHALILGIKTHKIGSVGLDVYEGEHNIFFADREGTIIDDDRFMRLLSFPNVLITGHQAFFTREALENIATSVADTLQQFVSNSPLANKID